MVHGATEDIKTIYPIFDDELNYTVGMPAQITKKNRPQAACFRTRSSFSK